MNVLIVGLDNSLLRSDLVESDTRQRHVDYASTLSDLRPGSEVFFVVLTRASEGFEIERVSENLTVLPSNSTLRELFFLDVLQIGRRLAREQGFDLVTTQTPFDDGLAGYLLARRYDAAYLAQLRPANLDDPNWLEESWLNRIRRPLGKFVCRRADGIRVESKLGEKWCRESLGVSNDRIHLDYISMSMLREDQLESPGVKTDGDLVLYVGRLSPEKNLSTLIRAFENVVNERQSSTMVIVGDGPRREALGDLVEKVGLGDSITFEGAIPYDELPEYYDQAAVLVLPSLRETFGRVILEAYSFETPVVATDVRGPSELVDHNETGLLVPARDPDHLAEALLSILDNPARRRRMGSAAGAYVRSNFEPDELVQGLVETWIKVVEDRSGI